MGKEQGGGTVTEAKFSKLHDVVLTLESDNYFTP